MRAIRQHAFGPPETLQYEEVPDPVPAEGQVRIAVEAAGVHLVDTALRRGAAMGPFALPELPVIPGREVAGRVDAVGPGGDAAWIGKRVVAHLGLAGGGYAELAVVSTASLHPVPESLAPDAAVAMIGTGRTALHILDGAAITAADVVLITAAAGGLGGLFVQAVRRAGAVAVGLAGGPHKVPHVQSLGAAVAVDYLLPDWPDRVRVALEGRAPTVLLDGVGGDVCMSALDLLGRGGRAVLFGGSAGGGMWLDIPPDYVAARGLTISTLQRPTDLRPLETRALAAAAAGHLVPHTHQFPLTDAAAAHAALENRATMGKVVLIPGR
jgi:NADPH:quinone reductase